MLLDECIKDHAKDIRKSRFSITEEIERGNFSTRPTYALRLNAKGENINSF
jgi:hypothetical protein